MPVRSVGRVLEKIGEVRSAILESLTPVPERKVAVHVSFERGDGDIRMGQITVQDGPPLFVQPLPFQRVTRHESEVGKHPAEFEYTPSISTVLEVRHRPGHWAHGFYVRRPLGRGEILHEPKVGLPDCTNI